MSFFIGRILENQIVDCSGSHWLSKSRENTMEVNGCCQLFWWTIPLINWLLWLYVVFCVLDCIYDGRSIRTVRSFQTSLIAAVIACAGMVRWPATGSHVQTQDVVTPSLSRASAVQCVMVPYNTVSTLLVTKALSMLVKRVLKYYFVK